MEKGGRNVFFPGKAGAVFKDGKLYIFNFSSVTVIKGYPLPAAWKKTRVKPEWHAVRPVLNIRYFYISTKRPWRGRDGFPPNPWYEEPNGQQLLPLENDPKSMITELKRRNAYRQFMEQIPFRIREELSRFSGTKRIFTLLQFVCRCNGLDLLSANSALGFCLAHTHIFGPAVQRPLRAARGLVFKKQKEILSYLRFPDTKSARRILAKVNPEAITVQRMFYLRNALWDPQASKLLAHIPGPLNAGCLRIATDKALFSHASPALLEEINNSKGEVHYPQASGMLRDTLEMFRQLEERGSIGNFRSIKALLKLHDELSEKMHNCRMLRKYRDYKFPLILPGNSRIIPILDIDSLVAHARAQQNCCVSFAPSLMARRVALFEVHGRQGLGTLSIHASPSGWGFGDLRAARNADPDPEMRQLANDYLAQALPAATLPDLEEEVDMEAQEGIGGEFMGEAF